MTGQQAVALAREAMPDAETGGRWWCRWTEGQRGRLAESLMRDDEPTLRERDVAYAVRMLMRTAPSVLR